MFYFQSIKPKLQIVRLIHITNTYKFRINMTNLMNSKA